jgi:hypothetical protein
MQCTEFLGHQMADSVRMLVLSMSVHIRESYNLQIQNGPSLAGRSIDIKPAKRKVIRDGILSIVFSDSKECF